MTDHFDPEKTQEIRLDLETPSQVGKHSYLFVQASPEADEHGLQFILLSKQSMSIGRSSECSIYLKDPGISRRHVSLIVSSTSEGPSLKISNLCNLEWNTFVGNQKLKPNMTNVLRQGDKLQLGHTILSFNVLEHEGPFPKLLENVTKLMKQAQYERALGGLTILKKYQLIGGGGKTSLEQILSPLKYHEARIHSIQGQWKKAIDLFHETISNVNMPIELRIKAAFQLGGLYVNQNNLEKAQQLVDWAYNAAGDLDGYFRALVLCLQGMTSARKRDFNLSRQAFKDAEMQLQRARSASVNLQARIQLESAVGYFLAEQHDAALRLLESLSEEVYRNDTQRVICAEALRYRGIIHSLRRDFEKADYFLRDALRVFQETKRKFLEYKAQKSSALNHLSWGRLEEASVHLRLCQKLLVDVENEYEQAVVAAHLGKVYLTRGEAQEALRWFEHEKNLQTGVDGTAHSQAYTHRNFARAHRNLGHADKATRYYELAVAAFGEFANLVQQGLTLVELCKLRLETGDVRGASQDLVAAEHCFIAAGREKRFEPVLNALKAQMAWVRNDHVTALSLFASSIRSMESSPPNYVLGETYLAYGQICAELYRRENQAQNSVLASEYYQEAEQLFDKGIKCAASQSLGYLLEQFRKEIERLDHREFIKLVLSRFVSPEPIEHLVDNSFHELNRFQIEERTVIFVDLSGYTALVEREDIGEVRDILNEFYGFATRIIHQYRGIIDKFIGDCVMATFKGSTTGLGLQNQSIAAVSAMLAVVEEVERLSERRFSTIQRKLAASAGACTGKVLVGLVGSLQKMNYTCIGDVVNVASRLQGLAKPGEVLISHETYQACMHGGLVPWSEGDIREARVKNRDQVVRFWSLDKETRKMVPALP